MMTATTQAAGASKSPAGFSQVEANGFCDCGYNLRGQVVTQDAQFQFPICRCPECGRCHPAEALRGGAQTWLNRLGLGALALWAFLLTGILGFSGLLLYGMQAAYVLFGTDFLSIASTPRREPRAVLDWERDRELLVSMLFFSIVFAGLMGTLWASSLWHTRRMFRAVLLLLPLLSAALVTSIWWIDDGPDVGRWALQRVAVVAVMQVLVLGVAIGFGRAIARGLVRLLVPPGPRQVMSFLWTADGKRLPQPEAIG